MALWLSGKVSVSYTGNLGFQPYNLPFLFLLFLSLNSANSVKTFRENSNENEFFKLVKSLATIKTLDGDKAVV